MISKKGKLDSTIDEWNFTIRYTAKDSGIKIPDFDFSLLL